MKFEKFNKIPRLSRDMIITEKIDGTNAQIVIISKDKINEYYILNTDFSPTVDTRDMETSESFINDYCLYQDKGICMFAGSKNRWLDCSSNGDNYGFAKWVKANAEELMKLGEGRHYGEWYGKGIQRGYELDEKRFALFNVKKWIDYNLCYAEEYEGEKLDNCPACCDVVPILYEGMFDTNKIDEVLEKLRIDGSSAVKGYLMPEGIIIYHTASGKLFKKTIMNDKKPKGKR